MAKQSDIQPVIKPGHIIGVSALTGALVIGGIVVDRYLDGRAEAETHYTQPITVVYQDETSSAQEASASVPSVSPTEGQMVAVPEEPRGRTGGKPKSLEPEPEMVVEQVPYETRIKISYNEPWERADGSTGVHTFDVNGFLEYYSAIRQEIERAYREKFGVGLPPVAFHMKGITEKEFDVFEEGVTDFPRIMLDNNVERTAVGQFTYKGKQYMYIEELFFDDGIDDMDFLRPLEGVEYRGEIITKLVNQRHEMIRELHRLEKVRCEEWRKNQLIGEIIEINEDIEYIQGQTRELLEKNEDMEYIQELKKRLEETDP